MINFRYHIVSVVAVFLALGIGVIMGSTVIDRVLVDTLEEQQQRIEDDIVEVRGDNDRLSEEVSELTATSEQLATEGSQRLLAAALTDVGVLVLGVRGVESEGLDGLVALLGTAAARYEGTLWLTERLALDTEESVRDMARALGEDERASARSLRSAALTRVARTLRAAAAGVLPPAGLEVVGRLREAGFLDYVPPEGQPDDLAALVVPGTRVVVVSGRAASVDDSLVADPLVAALVADGEPPPVPLLAAEAIPPTDDGSDDSFTATFRADDDLSTRLSTVDNIDDFAGRLAAVLALLDLGDGRVGHYGTGPSAQRLIPAPAE